MRWFRPRCCPEPGSVDSHLLRGYPRIQAERGAATLLVVALTGVLLLVGAASAVVGAIVVAHRQAQAAADLAALSAAAALAGGSGARDPCTTAGGVARDNRARLTSCRVDGRDVLVTVVVTGPRWLGQDEDLTASARAGPAAR